MDTNPFSQTDGNENFDKMIIEKYHLTTKEMKF